MGLLTEIDTQWEGGYRVPCLIRWLGIIKAGRVISDIGAHEDMVPTLLAAVGGATVKEDLLKVKTIGDIDVQGASRQLQPDARVQG
jgi:arylsulfatase